MKFKFFSTILILSLVLIAGCAQTPSPETETPPVETTPEPSEFDDWLTYESPEGFSFKYPQGYQVFQMTQEQTEPESVDTTILHIVSTEMEGMTPSMQINVSSQSVSFSLWEGMEWDAFPKIVETFQTK